MIERLLIRMDAKPKRQDVFLQRHLKPPDVKSDVPQVQHGSCLKRLAQ
jgi:hypothetical protein